MKGKGYGKVAQTLDVPDSSHDELDGGKQEEGDVRALLAAPSNQATSNTNGSTEGGASLGGFSGKQLLAPRTSGSAAHAGRGAQQTNEPTRHQ